MSAITSDDRAAFSRRMATRAMPSSTAPNRIVARPASARPRAGRICGGTSTTSGHEIAREVLDRIGRFHDIERAKAVATGRVPKAGPPLGKRCCVIHA